MLKFVYDVGSRLFFIIKNGHFKAPIRVVLSFDKQSLWRVTTEGGDWKIG